MRQSQRGREIGRQRQRDLEPEREGMRQTEREKIERRVLSFAVSLLQKSNKTHTHAENKPTHTHACMHTHAHTLSLSHTHTHRLPPPPTNKQKSDSIESTLYSSEIEATLKDGNNAGSSCNHAVLQLVLISSVDSWAMDSDAGLAYTEVKHAGWRWGQSQS